MIIYHRERHSKPPLHSFRHPSNTQLGVRALMDSGGESILKVGWEWAREREGQKGHHGFLCRDG